MPRKSSESSLVETAYFYKAARGLLRNPPHIIAQFIAMVYAAGTSVISQADGVFYSTPLHSVVFFWPHVLSLYLVEKFPLHLYSPLDFRDEGAWMSYAAPKDLKKMEPVPPLRMRMKKKLIKISQR